VVEEQSSSVQASWSSQFNGVWEQPEDGQQESIVQAFLSQQLIGLFSQTPPEQESAVHKL
jgi:hypothetical protein